MHFGLRLSIGVIVLAFLQCGQASMNIWQPLGPNGGNVSDLVASPFSEGVLYASAGSVVYKSLDGGEDWSQVSERENSIFQLEHSRVNDGHLLGSGRQNVYFSGDGGRSWEDRSPAVGVIESITASWVNPGQYFLTSVTGVVLVTNDSGLTWVALPPLDAGQFFSVNSLAINPENSEELLVSTQAWTGSNRLFRGLGSGDQFVWEEVLCAGPCPWEARGLEQVAMGSNGIAWAIGPESAFKSIDRGQNWFEVQLPFGDWTNAITIIPSDESVVYLSGYDGLAFTADGGLNWSRIRNSFIPTDLGQSASVTKLVIDPFDPGIQYAISTTDGLFKNCCELGADNFSIIGQGLFAQNIRAMEMTNNSTLLVGISDTLTVSNAIFQKPVDGKDWNRVGFTLQADHLRSIEQDPNNPDVIYASGVSSSKLVNGTTVDANGGIYKSIDGGLNWSTIDVGIPLDSLTRNSALGIVRDLAIDQFSVDVTGTSQVIYVVGEGLALGLLPNESNLSNRIYKSINAGQSWEASDNGLGGIERNSTWDWANPIQIVQDISDETGNTLYVATTLGKPNPLDEPTVPNGVFKSTNGGELWFNVTSGLPRLNDIPTNPAANVLSLAYDPTDLTGQTLYVSVNDQIPPFEGVIYKTHSGGDSWFFAGDGLGEFDVRDIIVNPENGDVYAAALDRRFQGDGGVFVTKDGGQTWNSISAGLPKDAETLKLELKITEKKQVLYTGTSRGIFALDVSADSDLDGSPDTIENSAPNAGDGNLDGTPDSLQSNVASIRSSALGATKIITVEVLPIAGKCQLLNNSFDPSFGLYFPPEADFESPEGAISFRIRNCEQAEIRAIFHESNFSVAPYVFRSYSLVLPEALKTDWETISAILNEGEWTFTLTDGELGDSTEDDGVIFFQGAPKIDRLEILYQNSFEAQ